MSLMAKTTDPKLTPVTSGHAKASLARAAQPARPVVVVQDSPARERSSTARRHGSRGSRALHERMAKINSLQRERDEHERMLGAVESNMFASALGASKTCTTNGDQRAHGFA